MLLFPQNLSNVVHTTIVMTAIKIAETHAVIVLITVTAIVMAINLKTKTATAFLTVMKALHTMFTMMKMPIPTRKTIISTKQRKFRRWSERRSTTPLSVMAK